MDILHAFWNDGNNTDAEQDARDWYNGLGLAAQEEAEAGNDAGAALLLSELRYAGAALTGEPFDDGDDGESWD